MAHHEADVESERQRLDDVEELRERPPRERDAGGERLDRDRLDPGEQSRQEVFVAGLHRREGEATVPGNHRGDPVQRRRRQCLVPEDLRVVVRVEVDEAGDHREPVGVDRPASRLVILANPDDPPIANRDIGGPWGRAGPVDDASVANE